jgi:hypothetical protein
MLHAVSVLAGFLAVCLGGFCQAADAPKIVAVGEWSKPVTDDRGYTVRGRLMLCEKMLTKNRPDLAVYVELQDATESIGRSLRLFCDLGKNDFRPEYQGGLQCELRDKAGKTVMPAPFAFSGAVPRSQWVTVPSDGTIRLRASPFGIYRPGSRTICPHPGVVWLIGNDDPAEFELSGTFVINPSDAGTPEDDEHVWRGTIELPTVRIASPR